MNRRVDVTNYYRIKRSIQAKYNTDVSFITAQILANKVNGLSTEAITSSAAPSTMAELEAEERERMEAEAEAEAIAKKSGTNTRVVGFVRAEKTEPEHRAGGEEEAGGKGVSANPDAIEIDVDDSDEDEEAMEEDGEVGKEVEVEGVQKIAVPDAVFGGLASLAKGGEEEKLGAKERFKRKR